jgi:hypothetical protein
MIKSRTTIGMEHVACVEEIRNTYRILVRKPEGKKHLEDLRTDGRIILKLILKRQGGRVWIGFTWLKIGISGSPL